LQQRRRAFNFGKLFLPEFSANGIADMDRYESLRKQSFLLIKNNTVESSNHSKNAASPKSQMSREKTNLKMETRILKKISNMDTPALTGVIDYCKDYDPKTVLLAYTELKKRNYQIPEKLTKKLNEYCSYFEQIRFLTLKFASL